MKTFEIWFDELVSNHVWAGPAMMQHTEKEFKDLAHKVYMDYTASNGIKSIEDSRRHVYNLVVKTPSNKKKIDWAAKALEKMTPKEEWKPASPEHVDKCVAEFDEMMKNSSMVNAFPRVGYKQSVEEGGWLPKKPAPYPVTSLDEAYVRQRHFEYVKANYEPRTGEKLPTWIPEYEFNLLFDNNLT